MTKSSVDKSRSRYGEKFTLRFHKPIRTYHLTCSDCNPILLAKFTEADGCLALHCWETLEKLYNGKKKLDAKDSSDENLFRVVNHQGGMKFLAETKTNYILPVVDMDALCILLNYVLRNGDIPHVDTGGWWKKEEFKKYLEEDTWGSKE